MRFANIEKFDNINCGEYIDQQELLRLGINWYFGKLLSLSGKIENIVVTSLLQVIKLEQLCTDIPKYMYENISCKIIYTKQETPSMLNNQ